MKILVAYISKTGTTEEIAKRIGEILSAKGAETNIDVEVAPIDAVGSVQGYDRLILGSPINGMKVLPQFKEFLSTKVAGSNIPTDIFIISYLFERGRNFWKTRDPQECREHSDARRRLLGRNIRRKAPRTSARLCAPHFRHAEGPSARHARLGQD